MTSERQTEGYARLPEDLLHDLLEGAGQMVSEVESMLGPMIQQREGLRRALRDLGLIQNYQPVSTGTMAGIDGGFAVERTAAVDILLAVAVGVEGLGPTTTVWESTQFSHWAKVVPHDAYGERLARGIMIAHEIDILNKAPHRLRILDGSHLTLVIQLNSALSAQSEMVLDHAAEEWARLGTAQSLADVCHAENAIAMPKLDSSRDIAKRLEERIGQEIPGDDKYLMGLVLEPGELLTPQRVAEGSPWTTLHFTPGLQQRQEARDFVRQFTEAIEPLRSRQVNYTYFKPDEFAPAFRIEMKQGLTDSDINLICSSIADQITGPFVREPYPQYLADVMAKSVGLGLTALQTAVQLGLSRLGRPEISRMLIHSYRTEGV